MENRVVCYYCGTIYDAEDEKCPLCGGKTLAKEAATQPVQRQRITDEERKQRQRASKGGKFAANNKKRQEPNGKETSRTLLIAALIFLTLSVAVVTWFIGDMIGWWGGLEDSVDRPSMELSINQIYMDQYGQNFDLELKYKVNEPDKIEFIAPNASVAVMKKVATSTLEYEYVSETWRITSVSEGTTKVEFRYNDCVASCEIVVKKPMVQLSANEIRLEDLGQQAELKVSVHVNCNEQIQISWPKDTIAKMEENGPTVAEGEYKTDSWLITAVSEGVTMVEFRYEDYVASCQIIVGEEPVSTEDEETTEPTEPSVPDDYVPELNIDEDISLYQKGETVPLSVENLPDGVSVEWSSSDELVAKVDENGIVTAISNGTTVITANVGGKTAEITIRCPFDESGNIDAHLSHEDVTIAVGESFRLYLLDSNNERITDVTYTMSKEGVCTVENGKVTGVKGGTNVTITIIYNTHEYKCIVRVRK